MHVRFKSFFLSLFFAFALLLEVSLLQGAVTYVYWADTPTRSFRRAPVNGGPIETIFTLPSIHLGSVVRNVEAHDSEGYIYYTYYNSADGLGKITKRPFSGGTEITLITNLTSGIDFPLNLAFDNIANKLYFSDGPFDVWRMNTDGTGAAIVASDASILYPRGIAVDPANGYYYITTHPYAPDPMRIQRRPISLSGATAVTYSHAFESGSSIAGLDLHNGVLYFIISGTASDDGIWKVNVDGTGATRIVNTVTGDPTDIQVDPYGLKVYWSEANTSSIKRCNLDGSNVETVVSGAVPRGLTLTTLAIPEPETYGLILGGVSLLFVLLMRRSHLSKIRHPV